jgi:5-methylcytosine-specific restriction protein A
MPIPSITSAALLEAMTRFDEELRDSPEWAGWQHNKAHLFAIEHDGNRYPVKQIVSMATGLPVSEFSGGRAPGDANTYASARGFTVVELHQGRNPTWVRDELILAFDMYLRYSGNPPGKESTEIIELSDTLNRLARYLGLTRADRFRNANGVYMKLMNFRRFDPAFTGMGKVGLMRGGKTEEEVWNEFAHDPARCHAVAETIRQALGAAHENETIGDLVGDEIEEAEEGRIVTALHRRYERSAKIIQATKKQALASFGKLACEACGFDFQQRYGEHGQGFIECHHTRPIHTLKPGEKTKTSDLKLLCSNCHRMVHAKRQWLSMEELIAIVSARFSARQTIKPG